MRCLRSAPRLEGTMGLATPLVNDNGDFPAGEVARDNLLPAVSGGVDVNWQTGYTWMKFETYNCVV